MCNDNDTSCTIIYHILKNIQALYSYTVYTLTIQMKLVWSLEY